MLEHVFLWCLDRRIYVPSRNELERVVRSQRQDYLDTWLIVASDRLSSDAVALLEASLADPDSSTGFNRMKGDAGQATLDNILDVTEKLAFIQRLRSEEHTSELQSLMRISYAVFCLKKKTKTK